MSWHYIENFYENIKENNDNSSINQNKENKISSNQTKTNYFINNVNNDKNKYISKNKENKKINNNDKFNKNIFQRLFKDAEYQRFFPKNPCHFRYKKLNMSKDIINNIDNNKEGKKEK